MKKETLGKVFEDGEMIVHQYEKGDCMYVVQKGQVEVFIEKDGEEMSLATLTKGDFFGEMAIFENEVRSASVRSRGESQVLTVDKKGLLRRIHEDPSLAFRIMEQMAHRIRKLDSDLIDLQSRHK